MAFRLVKTGKSYSDQGNTPPPWQGNGESDSLPEGYRLKYSDDGLPMGNELQEIVTMVHSEGYVLLWSNVLEDLIAFYNTEGDRNNIPPGFVPYSEAELWQLFGQGKPQKTPQTLKLIHEVKKQGGRVSISRSPGKTSNDNPGP